ncbi:DUF975 family protein, partial [Flavobacteriaceae bacterium]|nr:DUF975 family protein [Flavobacteriaceae bacterium]
IVVTCVSAYIQLGLAVYCIGLYKGDEVNYLTIFSRFNGLKPIVFILILVAAITLGFILLIVPGIVLALMYSQVFFILADDPDVGAIEAFNKSEKMMRGHKLQLFMLNLEAALYLFAGVFTLFIWWAWLVPRYSVAQAGFYEELKKQNN